MRLDPPPAEVLRAALLAVLNSLFSLLVIFNIVEWAAEQVAALNLFISTMLTLFFLFYPIQNDQ